MNIKKTAKKITAVLAGATMLGATVMGAMAMDLGDFPAPLIQDGVWNGRFVIGANSAPDDNMGAVAMAIAMPELGKVPVSVGGGVITVEGGELFDDLLLNGAGISATTLDERELEGLIDGSIKFNRNDYDVKESVILNGLTVETAIAGDADFGTEAFLTYSSGEAIEYKYEFIDEINTSEIGTGTGKDVLKIMFLNKELEITNVNTAGDRITLSASNDYWVDAGDSVTVDDKEVRVLLVGEDIARIQVGSEIKILNRGDTHYYSASDIEVELDTVWYVEGSSENGVNLKIGNELEQTIADGDSMSLFGEPTQETEAEWLWSFNVTGQELVSISAVSNMPRTLKEVSYADQRPALAAGDSVSLPNEYVEVEFLGLSNVKYSDVTVRFSSVNLNGTKNAVIFETSEDSDLFFVGTEKTKRVYVEDDETIWYEDGSDRFETTESDFTLVLGKEVLTITPNATSGYVISSAETQWIEDITLDIEVADRAFGVAKDAEGTDILIDGDNYGANDEGIMTSYGVIITNPEAQMKADRVVMEVPHEYVEGRVLVKTKKTEHSTIGGDTAYVTPVIDPKQVIVLDTNAGALVGNTPLIVVGGPNANSVAATLLEVTPFSEEVGDLFTPGRAMIKLFADENAILVAGYSGADTYVASLALADFNENKEQFVGQTEVEVVVAGTTVSSIVGK